MPSAVLIRVFLLGLLLLHSNPQKSDGQLVDPEWCVADEQTLDDDLQNALEWACTNGADCKEIQPNGNGSCYLPNTLRDHASFAFNSYYQNMKNNGGSCYFHAAALVTSLDPSHGPCKYKILP